MTTNKNRWNKNINSLLRAFSWNMLQNYSDKAIYKKTLTRTHYLGGFAITGVHIKSHFQMNSQDSRFHSFGSNRRLYISRPSWGSMAFVAVIGKTHIRLPKSSTQKDAENFPSLVDSLYRMLSKASEKELSEIDTSYWPNCLKLGLKAKGLNL